MDKNDWQYAEAIQPIAYQKPPRSYLWLQVAAAFGFLICLYFMVGSLDYADELTAEAQAKLDRAEAIKAEHIRAIDTHFPLSHPIPFDAVVIQSGPGIDKAKPRLYVKASNREGSK